jgi:nicotinate phosphoribosyltransferase
MLSFSISGSYTDLYQLTMSEAYFLQGKKDAMACFDYFFRKIPYQGGYVIFAGLQDVLNILADLHFSDDDLSFLTEKKLHPSFIEYLRNFRFNATIYSCKEGEIVFPNCPILRIEGNIIEAQIVETLLLNILNFQSLIATKAARMKYVAGKALLSDFGLRRAQGLGSIHATRAAVIGGFESTSNVYAAQLYNIPVAGTMAHAFVESYESELEAFRAFVKARPHDCTFLVDTYDTLRSGIPNAIAVAKEMEQQGHRTNAIRLDSGDLAYLSRSARKMLDEAGLHYIKIVVSNQLDEFVIKSLNDQGAAIDVYGVGTRLVTGQPDAALDGVYKLSMSGRKPRLKLSESLEKTTLPGIKQVRRVIDYNGSFYGADAVVLAEEEQQTERMLHPFDMEKSLEIKNFRQEPLLEKVIENRKIISSIQSPKAIAAYASERLSMLPSEYKRFENPHRYKVGISKKLLELRDELKAHYKK